MFPAYKKSRGPEDFVAKLWISVESVWAAIFKYLLLGQIWGDFVKGGRTYNISILKNKGMVKDFELNSWDSFLCE